MDKRKYNKPRLDIEEQIQLLQQQGLRIDNVEEAYHVLKVVGYYRFSGYMHPFKLSHQNNSRRSFKSDVNFNYIWEPNNHWKNNLFNLFDKYDRYPGLTMGFSIHWKNDSFWENKRNFVTPFQKPIIDTIRDLN